MENSVMQEDIALVLSTHSLDSSSVLPQIVVQIVDLEAIGDRYKFSFNDGKLKIKAMLPPTVISDSVSGKIKNLGLIRLLDYVVTDLPGNSGEKYLFVEKSEVDASTLDSEIKTGSKASAGIILKPYQDFVVKPTSQIINDHKRDAAPPATMNMSRRVYPLVSLNPCEQVGQLKFMSQTKET